MKLYFHPTFDENNLCPHCGLPFEPVEWFADLSGIGDDMPEVVAIGVWGAVEPKTNVRLS